MFRALLLVALTGLFFNAQAQVKVGNTGKVASKPAVVKHATHTPQSINGNETDQRHAVQAPAQSGARSTVGTQIGNTTYDLQTNYGVCRRVALESSGTVHATWTRSTSGDVAAPDRGTGYNVSADNGATWGTAPTARIEGSLRTGWPNVGVTASGRIFSITHTSAQGMNFCYKDPGALGWTNRIIGEELGDITGVWPRVGNDGNNIHAVISRQEGIASGVTGGLFYFRSLDGGNTWEGPLDIPGLDESYVSISADSYFVDVNGSNVAIVIGQYGRQLVVYKSTDNGDNWTKIIAQNTSNPLIPETPVVGDVLDPVAVAGGGVSTIIDNSGKVHVWFDRVYNYKDADQDGGPFYLPNSTCIMYWNEDMAAPRVLGETVRQDYDQDGTTSVDLSDTAPGVEIQSYGVSMVSHPSAGIDAAGNLYLAYSSMMDGAYEVPDPNTRRQYRDIFLIKSTDGGMTWTGPLNVTNSNNEEDVYPSIARTVNDKVHLVWQNDLLTGTFVQNANNQGHATVSNNGIFYIGVPVGDIVTPSPLVNTSPEIHFLSIPNAIKNCELTIGRFSAHALDYPDGEITGSLTIGGTIDVTVPAADAYTIELIATDSDGNQQVEQFLDTAGSPVLVTVFDDTNAPLVEGNPAEFFLDAAGDLFLNSQFEFFQTVDVIQGSTYNDLGVATWDESDNIFGCPVTVVTDNPVNTAVLGAYVVQYNVSDVAGNAAEAVTRNVNVIGADLTAPNIILFDANGEEFPNGGTYNVEVQDGGIWEDPGFFAYDNVDGIVTDNVVITGAVNLEVIGSYTLTYSITDGSGNTTTVTRVVVVADTQAPVINLIGPPTVTVPCSNPVNFTSPTATLSGASVGYTAFDNVDGNLTNNVVVNLGGFCSFCSGTYTITYNVTDAAGNAAIQRTRTVIVLAGCNVDCDGNCDGIVGINNPELAANITLYPNPSRGAVNVTIANMDGKADVKVYNPAGQLLQTTNTQTGVLTLDLSQYAAGMYFVEVTTQQGTVTKSVVVEK